MTSSSPQSASGAQEIPEVDILVIGAAGFVGRLTAEYLARNAPADLRIALTGRDVARVEQVRETLPGAAQRWPIVQLDLTDEARIEQVIAKTRVVVSTAGPYLRIGLPLVQACARAGVHYADLTGEVLFVYRSIDQADQAARASGARIVHSCGFDSVPSDLGMYLTAQQARAEGAGQIAAARLHVRAARGGLSGGTIDSMRTMVMEAAKSPAARRILADPYVLAGGGERTRVRASGSGAGRLDPDTVRLPGGVRRSGETGRWAAPFVMAGVNTATVHRSNALLTERGRGPRGEGYGTPRYHEVMDTGRGLRGLATAGGVAAGVTALTAGLAFGPTRALLSRVLPSPGEGPSADRMASGLFKVQIEALTTTGARYRTVVGAALDPGYRGTAVMLGQSALALAADDGAAGIGGVLTPAAAFGGALVERLRAADFTLQSELVTPDPATDG